MMPARNANITRVAVALLGACLFYGGLAQGLDWVTARYEPQREPHPGLRDDELQRALRTDWSAEHEQLSYWQARKAVFNEIDGNGRKAEGVYTGETITYYSQPLPNKGTMDHAWPLTRLPAEGRTDLHHLFPVIPEARVARVNLRYGDVLVAVWSRGGSKVGPSTGVKPVFEVRKSFRGDIARSMFYVATMYDLEIPDGEEKTLRKWHESDSPSRAERKRNEQVEQVQSSDNPFVDHPGLVDRISDF
jgi:hypothetical protein